MNIRRLVRQPVAIAILSFSVIVHGGLVVQFLSAGVEYELIDRVTYLFLIGLSAGISGIKPVIEQRWAYLIVAGVHLAVSAWVIAVLIRHGLPALAWTCVVAAETLLYLPAHVGSAFAVLFGLSYGGVLFAVLGGELDQFWYHLFQDLVVLTLVSSGTLLFRGYREELVQRELDVERLDGAVLRLSRANMSYQEFALDVEEKSTELERKRITRDIHDLVGYTLTNSIVTMEAAVDMIRVDPLRVPALLQSARDNAEEGLSQIRESLYRLRSEKPEHPKGVREVSRMVANFGKATSIEVDLEIGGVPPIYLGDDACYVTHHFVQEALINSFRHGRASKILVMLYWADDRLAATVWDNGPGKIAAKGEGIGISGMRERAAQVDGTISYENVIDGFSITLNIPRERLA
jgi:signal transduction histidine kinase